MWDAFAFFIRHFSQKRVDHIQFKGSNARVLDEILSGLARILSGLLILVSISYALNRYKSHYLAYLLHCCSQIFFENCIENVNYVNVSILIKFSQKISVFTLIIVSSS